MSQSVMEAHWKCTQGLEEQKCREVLQKETTGKMRPERRLSVS